MKKFKMMLSLALFTLCITLLSAAPAQAKVALNRTSLTLSEGEKATLKITGTKKTVTWTSSDKTEIGRASCRERV